VSRGIDARLRVLYLASVAVGVFLLRSPVWLGAVFASQAVAWLVVGLGARRLLRQVFKLWAFAAVILISYALTAEDALTDRWIRFAVFGLSIPINLGGMAAGATMLLRVLTVIVGSQVARAGDPRAIAAGIGALGAPKSFALALDTVLALLGGSDSDRGYADGSGRGGGRGGGRGDGSGGGRRRKDLADAAPNVDGEKREGLFAAAKRIAKGDVVPLRDRIERQIARAEAHVSRSGGNRDVAVVAGLALTMLGIKALKILPNIQFAPGHKLILLTPLYIAAALMTRSRLGATSTGLVMGFCAFLMGDGRYGPWEILKHVAPGLVCDLLVPLVMAGGNRPGRFTWTLIGAASAAARFATIFVITATVGPPALAFAFLLPGVVIHTTFGAISGYVSHPLVALVAPEPAGDAPSKETA
jgi:hypothetical protein